MEEMQTTDINEALLDSAEAEIADDVKGAKKKSRKELFQINTHPATAVTANNRRDRRLKLIVMRVVAFCKREHEEGQLVPFRFFKKRASLMTGVSLSTIHRIETLDAQPDPPPTPPTSSSPPAPESGQSRPPKARQTACEGPAQQKKKRRKPKAKKGSGGGFDPTGGSACSSDATTTTNNLINTAVSGKSMVSNSVGVGLVGAATAQLIQYSDISNVAGQLHFQTAPPSQPPSTNASTAQPPQPAAPPAKRAKKAKRKVKAENKVITATLGGSCQGQQGVMSSTSVPAGSLQPGAVPLGAGVTTINVHTNDRPACTTWTTGAIGPFAVGELRADGPHLQVPAQIQVGGQPLSVAGVGAAIPVGAQLQSISVATAAGPHQFTGQMDAGGGWSAGTVHPFGTLQGTATVVGPPQVVQAAYHSNNPTVQTSLPQQQQQQQQQVFYQFCDC